MLSSISLNIKFGTKYFGEELDTVHKIVLKTDFFKIVAQADVFKRLPSGLY